MNIYRPLASLAFVSLGVAGLARQPVGSPSGARQGVSARKVLFTFGRELIFLDVATLRVDRLQVPGGQLPQQAAASPDGQTIAYTATARSRGAQLYLWKLEEPTPRMVGENSGYYADPRFSADGRWIYFAHNREGMGRPTAHMGQAYAQLYRMRPDGTAFEALSDEKGCHYSPAPAVNHVYFIHTLCHRSSRQIESLDLRTGKTRQLESFANAEDLAVTDGAESMAWVIRSVETMRVLMRGRGKSRPIELFKLRKTSDAMQLTWLDRDRLAFAYRHSIWTWSKTAGLRAVLDLKTTAPPQHASEPESACTDCARAEAP